MILLSFALAILLFLSNFHLCGVAGDFLRSVQLGIFGMVGFIAPLLLFVGTCFYMSNRGSYVAMRKIAASAALTLTLCGFAQLFFGSEPEAGKNVLEYYRLSSVSGFGGGLVGGLISSGLKGALGTIGAFLILLVIFLISVVCITEKSIVNAVKKHSDVAYQHAKEDMERRMELHAERQEERRRQRYEQRVRGVDLRSTYLEPYDEELDEGEDVYDEDMQQDADNGMDVGGESEGNMDQTAMESGAGMAQIPVTSGADRQHTAMTSRADMPQRAAMPDFATPEDARRGGEPVSPADVFTGNISMPDMSIPFDVDETEAEISAQQLVAEGIGRFEEEHQEELFLGKPASAWDALRSGSGGEVAEGQESEEEIPRIVPSHRGGSRGDGARVSEPGTDRSALEETDRRNFAEENRRTAAGTDKGAFEETDRDRFAETNRSPIPEDAEHIFLDEEPDVSQYQPEPAPSAWDARSAAEGEPVDAMDNNILRIKQTESDGSFAIPQEAKRVVTAGGKVIETDTEALKKKLESKRQEEKEALETGEATVEQQVHQKEEEPKKEYVFPPVTLLKRGSRIAGNHSEKEYRETAIKLQQTLRNFGVGVTVTNISCGPSVTRYELHPEQGVKVSKIVGLTDDIKLSLAAEDIRIEAPIPGKSAVGIEVPNKENNTVYLRDLLESESFQKHSSRLAFAVGKDIGGQVVVTDIAKMPHLLIAGATGSGKSVCINTLIMSIIFKSDPEDVKLIMVDPKVVELSVYNGIPHLLIPVVTDPKKASGALNWAVAEMTDRYKKFAEYNVRDLKGYNAKLETIKDIEDDKKPKRLPQIVIIVDELADLMMVAPGEVEDAICRLAQLARAAGIHLVIATQRPSVNVITGLIKANIPSRIAFSVSSGVDSRTIIDMNGAEKLLGKGDMLFYPAGFAKPQRVQGAFVSDTEVQKVVDFLTEQGMTADYSADVEQQMNAAPAAAAGGGGSSRDEYFEQAGKFIIEKEKASIGMLQRVFKIGFNRAARIMDQLAEAGVVGEEEGTKPRKVLMTMDEFEEMARQ
ncbi:MAG: DNA translocase FtsK 4TM domain-containing protein [Eubacteriales bacterium]|nr:DNA translocase FtsK 4TM domain-containing protein [Eubacteriales bacterium]